METKRYVGLEDVLSLRVTCKCGIAFEGNPEELMKLLSSRHGRCPAGCDGSWATGKETEEQLQRGTTQLQHFISQWMAFAKGMAVSPDTRKFSLAFHVKDDSAIQLVR